MRRLRQTQVYPAARLNHRFDLSPIDALIGIKGGFGLRRQIPVRLDFDTLAHLRITVIPQLMCRSCASMRTTASTVNAVSVKANLYSRYAVTKTRCVGRPASLWPQNSQAGRARQRCAGCVGANQPALEPRQPHRFHWPGENMISARLNHCGRTESYKLGASNRCSACSFMPRRIARSLSWSSPILPTLK
jgi:hypothetical protein